MRDLLRRSVLKDMSLARDRRNLPLRQKSHGRGTCTRPDAPSRDDRESDQMTTVVPGQKPLVCEQHASLGSSKQAFPGDGEIMQIVVGFASPLLEQKYRPAGA